jgi:hypothetical protein
MMQEMTPQDNYRPEIEANYPPGAICIASGELARWPHFTHTMLHVLRPKDSTIEMHCGLNVAANFNAGIRRMLADPSLRWAWIMGDDHEFEPDTLLRLLARCQDILVPLVVRRQPPFIPVLFKEPLPNTPRGQFPPYHWDELPAHGLQEVHVAGSAGMLIHRRVFERMTDPWFEVGHAGIDLMNEDVHFCEKARAAGFTIMADMDVQLDHWTGNSLRPIRTTEGKWTVGINLGCELQVALPPEFLTKIMTTIKEESKEEFAKYAIDPFRPQPSLIVP